MQWLKDIFYYDLVTIPGLDISIAPINIILVAAIVVVIRFSLRITQRHLDTFQDLTNKIKIGQKGDTLFRLFRQLFYSIGVILVIQSFSINNSNIHFQAFLDFEFFSVGQFSLKVYNIILAVFLLFVTRVILNLFKLYLHKNLSKRDWVDEGKEFTILQVVKYVVYTTVVVIIVRSTGVSVNLLLSGLAAFAVALGLGLQKIFSDYVSGFVLLFDGSLRVGDVIDYKELPAKIVRINIRTSHIETVDGAVYVVPNSELTSLPVETRNKTHQYSRYHVDVSVAYGSDVQLVKKLMLEAANHEDVSKVKKPSVFMEDFGNDGLIFRLHFWTNKPFSTPRLKSDIRFAIEDRFRQNGIEIPFPQRVVTIKGKMPAE